MTPEYDVANSIYNIVSKYFKPTGGCLDPLEAIEDIIRQQRQEAVEDAIHQFIECILHGDDTHCAWLKEEGEKFLTEYSPRSAGRG